MELTNTQPDVSVWRQRAEAALAANRNDEALECLGKALGSQPNDVHTLNSLGTLLGGMGRFEEAIAAFQKALAERPSDADLHYNLAFALQCSGRFPAARDSYNQALRLRPSYLQALNNRGLVLDALGQSDLAIADFEAALKLNANDPRTLNNLGHCYLNRGEPGKAAPRFEKSLTINPGDPDAIEGLGAAYRLLERCDKLAYVCEQIVAYAPTVPAGWVELGAALVTLNRRAEAERHFARAVELAPDDAATHARIGRAMLEAGDLGAAERSYAKACELQPGSVDHLHGLTLVRRTTVDDGTLTTLADFQARQDHLGLQERATLHFAFGRALSDVGDNHQSFLHFLQGNRLQRIGRPYDEVAALGMIAKTAELFSPAVLARCSQGGMDSSVPIFVIGMPRSGSTLVEQILAAHKQVYTLGELRAFDDAIAALESKKGSPFPGWISGLTPEDISVLADRYLFRLFEIARAHAACLGDASRRLVDKLPANFLYAGLIHLALPKAKIIHARRDPVDTCLSCFEMPFGGLPYTRDLGELGRYYRGYRQLMTRWHAVLPEGVMLDVDYRELVTDFEGSVRRIISYCELEWDDACLDFHKTGRAVRTVSAVQVRQPLYTTSLERWRPPIEMMKPLLEGLEGRRAVGAAPK